MIRSRRRMARCVKKTDEWERAQPNGSWASTYCLCESAVWRWILATASKTARGVAAYSARAGIGCFMNKSCRINKGLSDLGIVGC